MTLHNSHSNVITCVRFDNERIISGSVDQTIKVLFYSIRFNHFLLLFAFFEMWDLRTGRCLQTLDWKLREGHTGVVRNLQVDAWRIVSAADDRTVKVNLFILFIYLIFFE